MVISFFKVLDGIVMAINRLKYIAKTNDQFDSFQELNLVVDYRFEDINLGLFEGIRGGKTIRCLYSFSNIDIVKVPENA